MNKIRLEINVKQAPISKIVIYDDHIDIVTGKKKEEVLRTFEITSKRFLDKYMSFPMYINNMLNNEINNTYFFLEGLHVLQSEDEIDYIPSDDDYDEFTFNDFFNKVGVNFTTDMEHEISDYISDKYCILLSSSTQNFSKVYRLSIVEGDYDPSITSYINGNEYFDDDDQDDDNIPPFMRKKNITLNNGRVVPIKFKGMKPRLTVLFSKEDTIFYSKNNKKTDYAGIKKMKKINDLFSGESSEKLLNYNNDILITKKK